MSAWQVQEAKQRFSEVLRLVATDGEQIVTRHGAPVAVIMDVEEYRRLKAFSERVSQPHAGLFPPLGDDEYADTVEQIVNARTRDVPRSELIFEDVR